MDASSDRGGPLTTLTFLALLTTADTVMNNALPAILDLTEPQVPGSWNYSTAGIMFSTAADVVGQLVLGMVADYWGRAYSMHLNSAGILLAAVCSLLTLPLGSSWPIFAAVVAPICKMIGGGAHATAFFALALLCDQTSGGGRSTLFYLSGAIIVICQTVAATLTPLMVQHSSALPYMVVAICCLLAHAVAAAATHVSCGPEAIFADEPWMVQPLLPASEARDVLSRRRIKRNSDARSQLTLSQNMMHLYRRGFWIVGALFFSAAIAKATRPLFTTYIQHRAGVEPQLAQQIWLGRMFLSSILFAVILPLAGLLLPKLVRVGVWRIDLGAAKAGIVLIAIGAALIGIARTIPTMIMALVINTLGVATDLSLLSFAAQWASNETLGRFFGTIASLESMGILLGTATLFPVYKAHLSDGSLAGGTVYFICAAIYFVDAVVLWTVKLDDFTFAPQVLT